MSALCLCLWSSPVLCSLWSSVFCLRSLWSSPTVYWSAVSGHLLYCVLCPQSGLCPVSSPVLCPAVLSVLWSSPVLCPQSLVISCTSLWSSPAVSGHLLYCVRISVLVISCTVSAVSGHLLYCVRS
ncbi:unnamed protein product, partial [Staurois parvus]